MAYWDKSISTSYPKVDSVSLTKNKGSAGGDRDAFYEIEPGLVLDIILNKEHPFFKKNPFTVNNDKWPADVNNELAKKTDPDFTWMGRALIRLLYTQRNVEKEDLIWAIPLESNISEYPILNETVGVVSYLGQYYYTRKINSLNTPNTSADFNLELAAGGFRPTPTSPIAGNRELIVEPNQPYQTYQGPISKLKYHGGTGYEGTLGRYFTFNPRIRALKRREGDFVIESRFGQSIRFASYDDNRENDKGYNSKFSGYTDYKGNGTKYTVNGTVYESGGGNPMLLIRNRQRPLTPPNKQTKVYENVPSVTGTEEEKNVGGYITEDVNNDGSSIHMTSGTTVSGFKTNCVKVMWGNGSEEQPGFNGVSSFKFPLLMGDQIVINSDRVIISSKVGETLHYSKKRYAVVTDAEYSVDAHESIVLTTNTKTVLNSPAIYLGEYDQTNEPVLLGQTTVNWMYDLVQWLLTHTHWYKHTHPDAGKAAPDKTQTTVQSAALISLRDQLNSLMSRRVFVVGGGLAPGKNGQPIKGGPKPVVVTVSTGDGVPGGFTGANKKTDPSAKAKTSSDVEVEVAQTAALEALEASNQAKMDSDAATVAATTARELAKEGNAETRKAAADALNAQRSVKKHVPLVAKYATKSQTAASNAAVATNNVNRTAAKVEAVNESNKAKSEANIVAQEKTNAENAAVRAQVEAEKS